jgi:uncharacterized membrane protein
MSASVQRPYLFPYPPLHAALLGGMVALFLGALLSDVAYARSYQIQWSNFASWLVVGGLLVGAAALVCAGLGLMPSRRAPSALPHLLVLAAAWIAALLNALWHARDAWASMPGALLLSVTTVVLAVVAAWLGCRSVRAGGVS